jgi:hypothetical protein
MKKKPTWTVIFPGEKSPSWMVVAMVSVTAGVRILRDWTGSTEHTVQSRTPTHPQIALSSNSFFLIMTGGEPGSKHFLPFGAQMLPLELS